MHIGLIGGIGPAATDYYYRKLIALHAEANVPLELTIVHADLRELAQNLAHQRAREQAQEFARLIRRLEAAGARAVAVTSIAGHFCIGELEPISPLSVISVVPLIDAAIRRQNLKRVAILGTRTVMETRLYGAISAAETVLPEGEYLEQVHASYIGMAMEGRATDRQRDIFFSVGQQLCRSQGAQAVVLGGTDLFLAFEGQDCGFPVIDCAGIHVSALFEKSIGNAGPRDVSN